MMDEQKRRDEIAFHSMFGAFRGHVIEVSREFTQHVIEGIEERRHPRRSPATLEVVGGSLVEVLNVAGWVASTSTPKRKAEVGTW